MPNHTENLLTIGGDMNVRKDFTRRIKGNNGLIDFTALYPMPEGENWYNWNCNHWGTKWEPYDVGQWEFDEKHQSIRYHTAWTPPTEFYLYISTLFPQLIFKQEYIDEGCDFIGFNIIQNGKIIEEQDYEWESLAAITMCDKLDFDKD